MLWHPKAGLPSAQFYILGMLCLAMPYHYFLSTHVWGPPILALLIGAYFRVDAKAAKRPSPMPMLVCLFLGLMSLTFPLSDLQRCRYLIVGTGIVFALRSAIMGHRPGPERRIDSVPKTEAPAPRGLVNFIKWTFGKIEYVPVSSPRMEERVRKKYGSAIAELTRLGFEPECCYGETFPMTSLLRVVPAITTVGMWFDRQPWKIHEHTKVMACYLLLVSSDKTTYANPCEVGVKLFTAFTDGTFLVSAMGPALEPECGDPTMTKYAGAASIAEAWASHQLRIRDFESAGKQVDRQISFSTYADLSDKETALLGN
jgi:hypothetical protein